jgi:hypothetical protein
MTTNDRHTGGLRVRLIALLLVGMLAFPAFAAAQTPSDEQYDPVPCVNCSGSGAGGGGAGGGSGGDPSDPSDPSGLSDTVGPLPFTGFDVIAMVAVALAVTGVGLALQRAVSRGPTEQL